ncbi:MAG TPA: glycosyltransferase family 1 protein [Roseiarcus sp.]|nr:glycosyltransferase family 1 protein [Roseiarcus sp.]
MAGNVVYDGHNVTLRHATGIGTYARALAATAASLGFRPELLIGGNASVDKKDPQLSEVTLFDALTALKPSLKLRAERALASFMGKPFGMKASEFVRVGAVFGPSAAKLDGFQRVHVAPSVFEMGVSHFKTYRARAEVKFSSPPSLFHLTFPTPLRTRGCPNIYTIHDIVPLRLPETTLDNKKLFLEVLRHLCRKADHIVTVSEFSREDIMRFVGVEGSRITNTYQSVHLPQALLEKTDDVVANEVGKSFGLDFRSYYMFFGAIEPKKNVSRLIDAYAASGSAFPLIVVGALGWQYDEDVEKMQDDRFIYYKQEADRIVPSRKVRRITYLPFSQLMTLVKGARGVLFPSLYEGFGLPVLESMALGTPVVTSTAAALPEVSGGAAVLVDPTDVDALTRAIRAFDHDDGLRQELALRGKKRVAFFGPEMYQDRIAKLYARLGVEPTHVTGRGSTSMRISPTPAVSSVSDAI